MVCVFNCLKDYFYGFRLVSEPINLIVDSKDMPEDDDNTLVTVEAPPPEAVMDQVIHI